MRLNISCTACGGRLSGDEPGGLCPACLARVTFGLGPNLVGDQSSHGIHGKPQLRQFGDYELIHELGRGGMGVVYKAHQRSLDRIVAVKMILAGHFASRSDVQRFHAEAQNAARLRHPNIVSIYEVGDFEGQHFYAMEFVQGQRLADLARDQPLPSRQAARYLKALAEATHIGHLEGVIHRDLKPANILIDALDQPRITDFGLSRQLGTDSTLTLTGQAMGSPGYMAPEQASGRHEEIGPRSDVYGLGAILFHLLTARPPFHAASVPEVLRQLIEAEPLSPRLLNPAVPRDLETICLKCLTKEPQRRYASARKLAEDLDRFLCDEPVVARPASALEKSWRSCRRHPAVAGLSAAVLLLLLFVTVGSLWSAWRLKTARELAVRERDRAERTSSRLKLRTAERLLEEGDSSSAVAVHAAHQAGGVAPDAVVTAGGDHGSAPSSCGCRRTEPRA